MVSTAQAYAAQRTGARHPEMRTRSDIGAAPCTRSTISSAITAVTASTSRDGSKPRNTSDAIAAGSRDTIADS
jgi:hypothetical protein